MKDDKDVKLGRIFYFAEYCFCIQNNLPKMLVISWLECETFVSMSY